jgi:uncharacterized membrane protein YtjA (UPF0391 family)
MYSSGIFPILPSKPYPAGFCPPALTALPGLLNLWVIREENNLGLSEHLSSSSPGRLTMLHWSLIFLIIAIVAAIFGFTGIAGTSTEFAKILFVVFLVVWIISFIFGRKTSV